MMAASAPEIEQAASARTTRLFQEMLGGRCREARVTYDASQFYGQGPVDHGLAHLGQDAVQQRLQVAS